MSLETTQDRPGADAGAPILPMRRRSQSRGCVRWSPKPACGRRVAALAKYMVRTEVHTYAFSVAANVILSLFPFIVMLLTISRVVSIRSRMGHVVCDMMTFLPARRRTRPSSCATWSCSRIRTRGMQVYSVIMLLISCTGVFLPLEVALNGVWGVRKNRSYLHNQLVSLSLAFLIGLLAMASVALTAGQRTVLNAAFFGHTDNAVYRLISSFIDGSVLNIMGAIAGILIFFLIYWILPNRKVPARAVLPTAIVVGLLWEAAKLSLRAGAATTRLPIRLWPLLRLGRPDDLGVSFRPAAACRSSFLRHALCAVRSS